MTTSHNICRWSRTRAAMTGAVVLAVAACALPGCGSGSTGAGPDSLDGRGSGSPTAGDDGQSVPQARGPDESAVVADAAIVLRGQTGVVIDGRTIDADPSIELIGCRDITIIGCDLRSVRASGSEGIRVVNCTIHDSADNGVYFDDCAGVLVQGNRIERVRTGVLAHRSTGVRVIGNYVEDVQGPMPGGQLVQFDKVTGPGNLIARNYGVNHRGRSQPEDMVSLYQSHGTADAPIRIEANYLAGDPEHGSAGKSASGSGIMLGDGGGSWQVCVANTVINAGQVGIGVAGGEDIHVISNIVRGERSDVSNVGLYVWNQYDAPAGRVEVIGNVVAWVNAEGQNNPFWDGGGFAEVQRADNTFGGRSLLDTMPMPAPPSVAPEPPVRYIEPGP